MLQNEAACDLLRARQHAQASLEDEEDDSADASPDLWSCSSPHDSFPYPCPPAIMEACYQHMHHGLPSALKPPLPTDNCPCGGHYQYVKVKR